jgi:glycosyltransferase involved in cell wall biosynthesis
MRSVAGKPFLFISTMEGAPWGGSEELWSATAKYLMIRGANVAAAVKGFEVDPPQLVDLAHHGIDIVRRYSYRPWYKRLGDTIVMDNVVKKTAPSVVIISSACNYDWARWGLMCLQENVPYVVVIHAAPEWVWPDDPVVEQLRMLYERAVKCYFVSRRAIASTCLHLGWDGANSGVIWNPYRVKRDLREKWPATQPRFACVGRLEVGIKGQDLLLSAIRKLGTRVSHCIFSFYGDGPQRRSLERLCRSWKLDNVRFCGHIANPSEIWEQEQILILPSRTEAASIALMEALLSGRPAVVTDVGENSEWIKDGVNGFICDAASEGGISSGIVRALEVSDKWREMGRLAAEMMGRMVPDSPIETFGSEILQYMEGLQGR